MGIFSNWGKKKVEPSFVPEIAAPNTPEPTAEWEPAEIIEEAVSEPIVKPTSKTAVKKAAKKSVKKSVKKAIKKSTKKSTKQVTELTPKERADAAGEPWVDVLSFNLDQGDLNYGNFELDWNPTFVARLVKAGFQGKDDAAIVDQWFKVLCGSVATDLYAQEIADPEKRRIIKTKKLGNGRTEIS